MPTTTTIVAVTLLAVSLLALFLGTNDVEDAVSIAFVGNSFTFVNDLPRVMEALGNLQRQDSCLHGATSITSLLQEGNGMYYHWGNSSVGDDTYFPDFGACTVRQLLLGYDEGLANGYYDADYYTDDGLNPCFQDAYYLKYSVAWRENLLAGESSSSSFHWDYVVINDHSMAPAVEENKNQSVSTLWESYAPMLKATQSIPILFQTWAYWREDVNMTEFVDIPTFTLRLQEGYEEYAEILEEALPDHLKPEIAPVGLAFLVVWEENFSAWEQLFGEDLYHPSPHGTYLAACVIYTTIHKKLPPASSSFTTEVFNRSRSMQLSGQDEQELPTEDEALYLRWIARRVVLQGHVPKSLKGN